jgi:ribose transport system substrate-binding protein
VIAGVVLIVVLVAFWRLHRDRELLVAVIPETTAQELWESMHAGVASAARGTRWHAYWNGPSSEDEVAQQIALVQHAEAIHAAGLILAPDHPLALTTVVRHVLGRGIPTVIVASGMPLEPQANLGFVLNDDEAAGELAARYLATTLKGHGTVALLGNNTAIQSAAARAAAFSHTLATDFPGIRLIAQFQGSFRMGEAEQQTEEVLRNNPDIVALVTIGITQTRGSMLALHRLRPQGGIALLAFDQDLDLMYSLRHGDLNALIAQNTFEMGRRAMQMIERTHRGEPMPAITRVAPVLITPGNIDTPEVQQVLSMDWRAP